MEIEEGLIDLMKLATPEEPTNEPVLNFEINNEDPVVITEEPAVEPGVATPPATEEQEIITEEPAVQTEITLAPSAVDTRSLLLNIFGEGYQIDLPDEEGNMVTKPLEELDLTAEDAAELIKDFVSREKQAVLEDKISTKGVSEVTKTIIEIDKLGGDITQVLKVQEEVVNPLNSLDITTTEGQKDIIKLAYKNLQPDEVEIIIQGFEAKGVLQEKAEAVEENLREQIKNFQEDQLKKVQEQAEKKKEQIKAYKKVAQEHLKTIKVKDSVLNKAITSLVTETKKGRYEIDELFEKALGNPQLASELAVWLHNKEEYIAAVTQTKVVESKIEEAKRLSLTRRATTTQTTPSNTDNKGLLDLNKL